MGKARILAVDDQRYFRELIEGLLSDEGYEVQTAASGEAALHVLEREDFDVVVTDLVMPGIDGSELIRKIKERLPHQEVVMVTGVVDVKTAVAAMKLGATDYILKPFDRVALLDSIDKILKRRRLHDERKRLMEENLEFMSALSLFERAVGLFSTLAVEPLVDRILEGLCLETRAESGVVWVVEEPGSETLGLVGMRGLLRVEEEDERLRLDQLEGVTPDHLATGRPLVLRSGEAEQQRETMLVPIRAGGELVGLVRLTDKLGAEPFSEADRASADKFCDFGGIALRNALRFRALERRSLRDPDTCAYTQTYFEDAVRNEIQKGNRFAHRFSILRIDLGNLCPDAEEETEDPRSSRRRQEIVGRIEGALRSTDLLASADPAGFYALLPQTDSLGAGVLGQRIRRSLEDSGHGELSRSAHIACATFPADGTQLDSLLEALDARIEQRRSSLVVERPAFARPQPIDTLFDRMLELASIEPAGVEGQILRFVLEDTIRRPADRGLLFVSPGARCLPDVLDTLEELRGRFSRTEIVLIAEGGEAPAHQNLTWVGKPSLDQRRPFLVYFGDGPAYAMVGQVTLAAEKTAIFQTGDRALVEHLAFELQRELGIQVTV